MKYSPVMMILRAAGNLQTASKNVIMPEIESLNAHSRKNTHDYAREMPKSQPPVILKNKAVIHVAQVMIDRAAPGITPDNMNPVIPRKVREHFRVYILKASYDYGRGITPQHEGINFQPANIFLERKIVRRRCIVVLSVKHHQ